MPWPQASPCQDRRAEELAPDHPGAVPWQGRLLPGQWFSTRGHLTTHPVGLTAGRDSSGSRRLGAAGAAQPPTARGTAPGLPRWLTAGPRRYRLGLGRVCSFTGWGQCRRRASAVRVCVAPEAALPAAAARCPVPVGLPSAPPRTHGRRQAGAGRGCLLAGGSGRLSCASRSSTRRTWRTRLTSCCRSLRRRAAGPSCTPSASTDGPPPAWSHLAELPFVNTSSFLILVFTFRYSAGQR